MRAIEVRAAADRNTDPAAPVGGQEHVFQASPQRHRQFNELKAKRLPGLPDQKLTATPVTSAQAVKAWERALRRSAALLLAERRRRLAT